MVLRKSSIIGYSTYRLFQVSLHQQRLYLLLIEEKIQKEKDKLIQNWEDVGIRIEKARWGRFHVLKGKIKIELPKTTKIEKITKEEAIKMIESKTPKKKPSKKKSTKKKPVKKK